MQLWKLVTVTAWATSAALASEKRQDIDLSVRAYDQYGNDIGNLSIPLAVATSLLTGLISNDDMSSSTVAPYYPSTLGDQSTAMGSAAGISASAAYTAVVLVGGTAPIGDQVGLLFGTVNLH
ncbi:MAG: hypothetical protein M1819_000548 [Sarea resinae]|nr:MAG: hypothetical protein M1819_000548 [Sarea resinae]